MRLVAGIGVLVLVGTKVIEVDPRGQGAMVTGLGERPKRTADGVLHVVRERAAGAGENQSSGSMLRSR